MIVERVVPTYTKPPANLAGEYADALDEMLLLHDGIALAEAAESVVSRLPDGPVSLLASTMEGLALAAACAALRADGTDWQLVKSGAETPEVAHRPVVVEPVDGGRGWRDYVLRLYPEAQFIVGTSL